MFHIVQMEASALTSHCSSTRGHSLTLGIFFLAVLSDYFVQWEKTLLMGLPFIWLPSVKSVTKLALMEQTVLFFWFIPKAERRASFYHVILLRATHFILGFCLSATSKNISIARLISRTKIWGKSVCLMVWGEKNSTLGLDYLHYLRHLSYAK